MAREKARFGGEMAGLLWNTLHPSAFYTGSVCGILVVLGLLILGAIKASSVISVFLPMLILLFVTRIALNSAFGEPLGGFFAGSGCNWPEVAAAMGRLFVLNVVWIGPLAVLQDQFVGGAGLLMGGGIPVPVALLSLAAALLPPLFLVSAVAAPSFSSLWDTDHWKGLFRGRAPDLVALYAVYLGALSLALFSFVVAAVLGGGKAKLTMFLMMAAGAYTGGIALLLLGRLVGGFVRTGDAGIGADPAFDRPWDDPFSGDAPDLPAPGEILTEGLDDARAAGAWDVDRDEGEPALVGGGTASPSSSAQRIDRAVSEVTGQAKARANAQSLTEMLRANERLAETDPEAALAALNEDLRARGPHPMVMARVAFLQKDLAPDEAVATAREAVDLARKTGNVGALAEVYCMFESHAAELGLGSNDWSKMAASLHTRGRIAQSVELYGKVLAATPEDMSTIKALIQIAEEYLKRELGAEHALAIYDLLDELCPNHPFSEFLERGRETAERKLARAR